MQYPRLRNDYFDYVSRIGWGETETGRMIYEGPIEFDEIYSYVNQMVPILLLGDDFQGYCFGYNQDADFYGEVSDDGTCDIDTRIRSLAQHVIDASQRTSDAELGVNPPVIADTDDTCSIVSAISDYMFARQVAAYTDAADFHQDHAGDNQREALQRSAAKHAQP